MTNEVALSGELAAVEPLRYTPAGIPLLSFRLLHRSQQTEAGLKRQVECEVSGVAMAEVGDGGEDHLYCVVAGRGRGTRREARPAVIWPETGLGQAGCPGFRIVHAHLARGYSKYTELAERCLHSALL